MKVTVLFFAHYREKAETGRAVLDLPAETSISQLKRVIASSFPGLRDWIDSSLISVNQEFGFDEDRLNEGDEIAVFPPVSGGQQFPTVLQITQDPIDLDALSASITLPTTGAVCIFSGTVRGQTSRGNPHQTTALEYEAYIPMAEAKLVQVTAEIRSQWPAVEGIAIVQRIGRLEPGTPTVLIACSAAHRDTGVFEAARYGIDRLKEIVPIWKKEIGPEGEEWIEGDYIPRREDQADA